MDALHRSSSHVHSKLPPSGISKVVKEGEKDRFTPAEHDELTLINPKEMGHVTRTSLLSKPAEALSFIDSFHQTLALSSDDRAEKEALMKESPMSFYRAMPSLFFHDLSGSYHGIAALLDRPAPVITINGDMHAGNFGTFKSVDGSTVWGINDHDQAGSGSPEADLERLATSIILLARKAGISVEEQKELTIEGAQKYCRHIDRIASGDEKGPAYLTGDESKRPVKDLIDEADQVTQKNLLKKYTRGSGDSLRFEHDDNLAPLDEKTEMAVQDALKDYIKKRGTGSGLPRSMQILDICEKKGSGGSSHGLARYWALVAGGREKHPLIIELKQLLTPAVLDQTGDLSLADGSAVVKHQKEMGGYQNPLTGYTSIGGRAFLVREREAVKDTLKLDSLDDFDSLSTLSRESAQVLARAHGQTAAQARALSRWIGEDRETLAERLYKFASLYATQTEKDYQAFKSS